MPQTSVLDSLEARFFGVGLGGGLFSPRLPVLCLIPTAASSSKMSSRSASAPKSSSPKSLSRLRWAVSW